MTPPPPKTKPFEKIVGKGENAVNQHFIYVKRRKWNKFPFLSYIYFCRLQNAFNLDQSRNLFGKELTLNLHANSGSLCTFTNREQIL